MKKRIGRLAAVLAAAGILLTGCGKVDVSMYRDVENACAATALQSGGVLQIQSKAPETEDMNLCFTYCYDTDGVMQYCIEQTDRTGRRIFLEHHDGNVMQRWLLGHGSSVYDETDSEFVRYTKEHPYKYLSLLTNLPEKGQLTDIGMTESDGQKCYRMTLDVQKVTGEMDADQVLQSREVTYTLSADGLVCGYTEQSSYLCENTEEKVYTLTVTLSDIGAVGEVKLPTVE